jgi:(E)-4-hydroxy-3-methylbut-2-enyl-diphosphate synthase
VKEELNMKPTAYCESLFEYKRTTSNKVPVGELTIGGGNPIRVQSMTTTNTNDTEASVEQCIRIIEAGGELVRLTTQGRPEAENLSNIAGRLRSMGYIAPLVADVHYNPSAAEIAACHVEKIRINPGNFTGGAKRFDTNADNISDEEWHNLIVEKLRPLIAICKEKQTTIRIGVNHGSLSDRIMAKYGDTPQGMVASCIEYIDACKTLDFSDIVISIKASNTRIMVETVRLLSATMRERGDIYPLHLGVTEAGSDIEGRIKSAAGIGALLLDGLGDTIRVSLTEDPEAEIPVAQMLVDYVESKRAHMPIDPVEAESYSPYEYCKRETTAVLNIGGNNKPVAIADASGRKKAMPCNAEYIYSNDNIKTSTPQITDLSQLPNIGDGIPMLSIEQLGSYNETAMVRLSLSDLDDNILQQLKSRDNIVIIATTRNENPTAEIRALVLKFNVNGIKAPVIPWLRYDSADVETFQLQAATDTGLLFIDGLIDGLMLSNYNVDQEIVMSTTLEIMQATQVRYSKAEFISCPACGRTLYDIQKATRTIKESLGHLKGLKIGIMGCIVNGIGEMADADYGYVGAGPGKISLYKGKTLVQKELPESEALEALINIIKNDNQWIENK